ncbi:MAG TPA: hypothetical protein VFX16_14265 [Pseudonocardiaceae bacterium]|nr:hypothetical protein [Pseudonocardiaceae bacterium]
MDKIEPALADAFRLLRQDISGYLDEAEFLATKLSEWSEEDAQSARNLVPDLTTIVRGILLDHKESSAETCPTCNTRWPCSTVRTIHGLVKDPTHEFVKIAQRAYEMT